MNLLRHGLATLSVLAGLAACASTPPPAQPKGPDVTTAGACPANAECVTVKGDPCNPCGSCPGDSVSTMTKAEYMRLTGVPTCKATSRKSSDPPPQCAPCTG
jgi:hypothetical protein